jgi:hypothetical protein
VRRLKLRDQALHDASHLLASKMRTDGMIFCMTLNNVAADRRVRAAEGAERVAVPAMINAQDQMQSRFDSNQQRGPLNNTDMRLAGYQR